MQIFTMEMLIQAYVQSRELTRELFSSTIGGAWQNIVDLFSLVFTSVADGNWSSALAAGFILFSGILFLYRLVRKNLWMTFRSIIDK